MNENGGYIRENQIGFVVQRMAQRHIATIKGVFDRIRGRGLVFAGPPSRDRRRLILTPTMRSKTLCRELMSKAIDVSRQTLSPLTNDESRHLMELLKRVVREGRR